MEDIRWKKFTLCGDFTTDLRSLYMAWATPAGLEKWFLRKADFYSITHRLRTGDEQIQKGDAYTWYWHGYGNEEMQKGTVIDANGHDMIRFTFSGDSIVTVSFKTLNGLVIIEIEQTNIPQQDDPEKNLLVQCQIGWTFYLANLKSVTEGGKDLRNKRIDLVSCFK
ncbi:SRPBCC domain-containing protein [Mucilaginibacter conchicola]|uniref:SRPBCC domain-containing protein n=1 Tax=Mucilaginibacter conchicola TaxID=2303333 RepID=A0A372NPJ6_9SPHI|nr:SRPBCC domain-containing protein [Mucilaginibacter conchicola]RFZ90866.1 SRPBCC domain-containing protein [Mucilaginibacter conchicola]